MRFKCPYCKKTFKWIGGGFDIRSDNKKWEKSLFSHLYMEHEGELSSEE